MARAGKAENRFNTPPSDAISSFTITFQSLLLPCSREDADVRVRTRSAGWLTKAPAMPACFFHEHDGKNGNIHIQHCTCQQVTHLQSLRKMLTTRAPTHQPLL